MSSTSPDDVVVASIGRRAAVSTDRPPVPARRPTPIRRANPPPVVKKPPSNGESRTLESLDEDIEYKRRFAIDLHNCEQQEVDLIKGPRGLGFSLDCVNDDGQFFYVNAGIPDTRPLRFFIREMTPDGAAVKDGRIKVGDLIVSVNEVSVIGQTYSKVADILRNSSGPVRLLLARNTTSNANKPTSNSTDELVPLQQQQQQPSPPPPPTPPKRQQQQPSTHPVVAADDDERPLTTSETAVTAATTAATLATSSTAAFAAVEQKDRTEVEEMLTSEPTRVTTSTEDKVNELDVNGNSTLDFPDFHENSLPSALLNRRLLEAQQKRKELSEKVKELNDQIKVTSNARKSVTRGDEDMERKLTEAEFATQQAQRNMISLQSSFSAAQTEQLVHETRLREQIADLQLKQREIDDVVNAYRERDCGYSADREAILQRLRATDEKYQTQINELNEKIKQLESGDLSRPEAPTRRRSSGQVRLISHNAVDSDSGGAGKSSFVLPVIVSTSPRKDKQSSELWPNFDATDSRVMPEQRDITPAKALPAYLLPPRKSSSAADSDTWSVDRAVIDEPPNYPPPPVPEDIVIYREELDSVERVTGPAPARNGAVEDIIREGRSNSDSTSGRDRAAVLRQEDTGSVSSRGSNSGKVQSRDRPDGTGTTAAQAVSNGANYGSLDRFGRGNQDGSDGRSAGSDRDTLSSASGTLERQPHAADQARKSNSGLNPLEKLRKMFTGIGSPKESKQSVVVADDGRDSGSALNGGRQLDGDRVVNSQQTKTGVDDWQNEANMDKARTAAAERNIADANRWDAEDLYEWLLLSTYDLARCADILRARNIDGAQLLQLSSTNMKNLGFDGKERDSLKKIIKDLQSAINREKKRQEKLRKAAASQPAD